MKNNLPRKLLIISVAIAFFTILSGLAINLLTGDKRFTDWVNNNIAETTGLVIGVIVIILIILFLTYLYSKYSQDSQNETIEGIEPDVKEFHKSLKERYQKRYASKLDKRFEITLEVNEDWQRGKTQKFSERYDKNARISEAFPCLKELFDQKDGLLIVGEPGAGKTVLLLKLAINLLEKTNLQAKQPFPVIFNLASWNEDYNDFGEWLKAMLISGNGLSKDFAELLLHEKRFILLLDGLDELARNEEKAEADRIRAACLASLNNYLDGEKTIICCRIDEFVAMHQNISQDAPVFAKVEVLNLTEAEVLNSLEHACNHQDTKYHASARNLIKLLNKDENSALRKVLCTPFYFTIALEVFYQRLLPEIILPKSESELRSFLTDKYIQRKLGKTLNPNEFNKNKSKKWLKWLAQMLEKKQLVSFELAELQPQWLRTPFKYRLFTGIVWTFVPDIVFLLTFFLLIVSRGMFLADFIFLLFLGLVLGSMSGIYGLFLAGKKISAKEFGKFSLSEFFKLRNLKSILKSSFGWSLLVVLIQLLAASSNKNLKIDLTYSAVIFTSIFLWKSLNVKKAKDFVDINSSYQRLRARNTASYFKGLIIFWAIANISALPGVVEDFPVNSPIWLYMVLLSLYIIMTIVLAFIFGTLYALLTTPIFKHFILRFTLWTEGSTPLKYATFLDYAAETGILEKDGGFWRFRHQNLQDYFTNLKDHC